MFKKVIGLLLIIYFLTYSFSNFFIAKTFGKELPRTGKFEKLYDDKKISIGELIYEVGGYTKVGDSGDYVFVGIQYTYLGIENGNLRIKYNSESRNSSYSIQDEENNEILSFGLNANKKALIKTKNGKSLIITLVDEFNRITVEEE